MFFKVNKSLNRSFPANSWKVVLEKENIIYLKFGSLTRVRVGLEFLGLALFKIRHSPWIHKQ